MAKGRRLARSVSLNVPTNLVDDQITSLPNFRPTNSKSLKSKVIKFMTTKLFVNQVHSESTQTFTSSNFQIFVYFLRFIGLSYKIHQKETKSLMLFLLIYNFIIFCCQFLYGIILLLGLYRNEGSHSQWINVTHYSCLTIWIISIWLNIKIHSIKPRFIDEAFSSSSLEDRHIDKRNYLLKFVSIVCIIFIIVTVVSIEIARLNSNDRFGIFSQRSKKMPQIFICGIVCRIFEIILNGICLLVILSNACLFILIAIAITNESSNLIISIKRYSLSQNLDHLIYRYQSIEKPVRILEQNYSTVILAFILATVAGVFLDEFRSASHKLSDLQQQDSYCITSMKLLSFMLRLSYDTERIRVGKVFAITPQATVILILFFTLIVICLFAVDEGCINIF
uniref:Gustatory receptor n=1 Tax=Panagrolaimus sp. PS1159 TaxID=55785 RepID=A0AC35G1E2_9BILA